MTRTEIALLACVVFFASTGLAATGFVVLLIQSHKRERVLWRKQLRALAAIMATGSPTPVRDVTPTREETPEDRVVRQFSEESIARGVEQLRAIYESSGLAIPEPEVLRAEAISMLHGSVAQHPLDPLASVPRD